MNDFERYKRALGPEVWKPPVTLAHARFNRALRQDRVPGLERVTRLQIYEELWEHQELGINGLLVLLQTLVGATDIRLEHVSDVLCQGAGRVRRYQVVFQIPKIGEVGQEGNEPDGAILSGFHWYWNRSDEE